MTSVFDKFDRAVDDLSWRLGGDAEAVLGIRGQSVDGDRTGKRVFDDAASWRLMEAMCVHRRNVACARLRRIDATLSLCPEHVGTFRLAFTSLGRRVSAPLASAFTTGRVVLVALAAASEAATLAHEHRREGNESILQWLERAARTSGSGPTFDRLRISAEKRLLPALQAYASAAEEVARTAKDEADRGVAAVRARKAPMGRQEAESGVQRVARLVADNLRLLRAAGYE